MDATKPAMRAKWTLRRSRALDKSTMNTGMNRRSRYLFNDPTADPQSAELYKTDTPSQRKSISADQATGLDRTNAGRRKTPPAINQAASAANGSTADDNAVDKGTANPRPIKHQTPRRRKRSACDDDWLDAVSIPPAFSKTVNGLGIKPKTRVCNPHTSR